MWAGWPSTRPARPCTERQAHEEIPAPDKIPGATGRGIPLIEDESAIERLANTRARAQATLRWLLLLLELSIRKLLTDPPGVLIEFRG